MKHDFLLYMKILTLSNGKLLQEEFEYIGKKPQISEYCRWKL